MNDAQDAKRWRFITACMADENGPEAAAAEKAAAQIGEAADDVVGQAFVDHMNKCTDRAIEIFEAGK